MRPEPNIIIDKYRASHPGYPDTEFGDSYGYFQVPRTDPDTKATYTLRIISSGVQFKKGEWEHVSVSRGDRCPSWDDMCFVKDMFWDPEEAVMQFHPPKSQYVNAHPFCLHLWKQFGVSITTPPTELIGPLNSAAGCDG